MAKFCERCKHAMSAHDNHASCPHEVQVLVVQSQNGANFSLQLKFCMFWYIFDGAPTYSNMVNKMPPRTVIVNSVTNNPNNSYDSWDLV